MIPTISSPLASSTFSRRVILMASWPFTPLTASSMLSRWAGRNSIVRQDLFQFPIHSAVSSSLFWWKMAATAPWFEIDKVFVLKKPVVSVPSSAVYLAGRHRDSGKRPAAAEPDWRADAFGGPVLGANVPRTQMAPSSSAAETQSDETAGGEIPRDGHGPAPPPGYQRSRMARWRAWRYASVIQIIAGLCHSRTRLPNKRLETTARRSSKQQRSQQRERYGPRHGLEQAPSTRCSVKMAGKP